MKIELLFTPPSEKYDLPYSAEELNDPLQTGPAVLAAHLRANVPEVEVECIGNQVVSGNNINDYEFRYRTVEEIVNACEESDIIGMTALFSNLGSSLDIASKLKERSLDKRIILGGQGVSNRKTAELILKKNPAIDYIVSGDGEDSLLGIVRGGEIQNIPNLYYRDGQGINRANPQYFNLDNRPIFDFTTTPDHEVVLRAFDSRTGLFGELRREYGNFIGRVGVQLTTGCEKAAETGPCSYCTSQRTAIKQMNAERFWMQIQHLYKKHGITEYFITDDILAVPEKVDALLKAREGFSLPEEVQFRAYGYVPYCIGEAGEDMLKRLKQIGVVNLFMGIENFDGRVNKRSNKPEFKFNEVYSIVKSATENGIDLFLPIMTGLPGESKVSLDYNTQCLETLLKDFGKKEYGQGGVVRVDLSKAMPLRGTPWFNRLAGSKKVLDFYRSNTGKNLAEDIDPDYDILREASIQYLHPTDLSFEGLNNAFRVFQEMCCRYIRSEQIGGYEPCRNSNG